MSLPNGRKCLFVLLAVLATAGGMLLIAGVDETMAQAEGAVARKDESAPSQCAASGCTRPSDPVRWGPFPADIGTVFMHAPR